MRGAERRASSLVDCSARKRIVVFVLELCFSSVLTTQLLMGTEVA